jgi:hypothetical protein
MSSMVKAGDTGAGGEKGVGLGFASIGGELGWGKSEGDFLEWAVGGIWPFSWEGFFGDVDPKKNTTISPRVQRVVKVKVAHFIGTGVPIYR